MKTEDEKQCNLLGIKKELNTTFDSNVVSLKRSDSIDFKFKEGGWGWVCAIACAFCFGLNIGLINIYSLIYEELIKVYKDTEHQVMLAAWIGSTSNGIQYVFCSISSVLVDFFNAQKIGVTGGILSAIGLITSAFVKDMRLYFLTYGFMLGIGQSLLLSSFLSILPHYFKKRLGLANGIMTFFSALITISLPFAILECLQKLGLANTFHVLGGLSAIGALCGLTFIPQLPDDKSENFLTRLKNSSQLKVFRMKRFNVWVLASCVGFLGYLIPAVTISHYVVLMFPEKSPAVITSLFGAISGVSGLILGRVSDLINISPVYFHTFSFLLGGIIQITLPFIENFLLLCLAIGFCGVADSLFLSFIVPVSCEVTKSHKLANQAVGYLFAIVAVPTMMGPIAAGIIYERLHAYDVAYYFGGGSCILASLILLIFYPKMFICEKYKEIRNRNKIVTVLHEAEIFKRSKLINIDQIEVEV